MQPYRAAVGRESSSGETDAQNTLHATCTDRQHTPAPRALQQLTISCAAHPSTPTEEDTLCSYTWRGGRDGCSQHRAKYEIKDIVNKDRKRRLRL